MEPKPQTFTPAPRPTATHSRFVFSSLVRVLLISLAIWPLLSLGSVAHAEGGDPIKVTAGG